MTRVDGAHKWCTSRKVAFRVDQQGVTLGGGPLQYEAHTSFFPWEGVHAVVLWRRTAPPRRPALRMSAPRISVWYVSVQRHTQLPRPAPEDLKADATRGMQAFRVDDARLAAAIATFAPAVQLIKLA